MLPRPQRPPSSRRRLPRRRCLLSVGQRLSLAPSTSLGLPPKPEGCQPMRQLPHPRRRYGPATPPLPLRLSPDRRHFPRRLLRTSAPSACRWRPLPPHHSHRNPQQPPAPPVDRTGCPRRRSPVSEPARSPDSPFRRRRHRFRFRPCRRRLSRPQNPFLLIRLRCCTQQKPRSQRRRFPQRACLRSPASPPLPRTRNHRPCSPVPSLRHQRWPARHKPRLLRT